jgi:hypothetical protein
MTTKLCINRSKGRKHTSNNEKDLKIKGNPTWQSLNFVASWFLIF